MWLLIRYNVTRSLEGYEAFGVTRAEEETDDPESKGSRAVGDGKAWHLVAKHRTGCNSAHCGLKRPPRGRILSGHLHPETLTRK